MDAALQINPYYGKTNRAGILAHFNAVLDYGPTIVYNVPARTSQDIPPELGPTRFLPGTATQDKHDAMDAALVDPVSPERAITSYCAGQPSLLALLEEGDASLYDSRLHHAGGPCFEATRCLFYVSFGHAANENYPEPPQRSLGEAVAARGLTLGDLKERR